MGATDKIQGKSDKDGLRKVTEIGILLYRGAQAESIGKTAFLGVAWPREAKPTPPGAAGSTVDKNGPKTLMRKAVWSTSRVEIGQAKRKFRLKENFRLLRNQAHVDFSQSVQLMRSWHASPDESATWKIRIPAG